MLNANAPTFAVHIISVIRLYTTRPPKIYPALPISVPEERPCVTERHGCDDDDNIIMLYFNKHDVYTITSVPFVEDFPSVYILINTREIQDTLLLLQYLSTLLPGKRITLQ